MNNKYKIKKDDFYCMQCNKKYKTYKTLWEHNKHFHYTKSLKNPQKYLKLLIKLYYLLNQKCFSM